jgi:hypothetical protein
MLENADDITDEDLTNESDNSKYLLLLLLGGFNFKEKFTTVFTNMLTTYSTQSFTHAEREIKQLGDFNITADQRKAIIDSIVADRLAFLLPEIERATRDMISANVSMSRDAKTVKQAIVSAYAVSNDRADTIADIEYRTIENTTRVETAEASGIVAGVLVSDGLDFDGPCIEADGQIWSLSYAGGNILQHPRCVRQFTFMTADEVKEHGGIDIE